MIATSELCALSAAERLRLIEDLWNSLVEDQDSLPDHRAVIAEVRARKVRFMANPSSGVPWCDVKKRIRSGRA
jgi:putative addiction module component (TIGR02574 family)